MSVFLLVVSIPLISALIGWFTNVVAIKLIFKPIEKVSVGPLSFQGIIPKYQMKFAHALGTMTTRDLLTAREIFERIEPEKVKQILSSTLDTLARDYVKLALEEVRPILWEMLPAPVKNGIVEAVRKEVYSTVSDIFKDLDANIEKRLDLYKFLVDKLTGDNVTVMEKLFHKICLEQLTFIERIGGYLGLAIGILQLILWAIVPIWWSLPIVGFIVGIITNWIAIKMVFEPREPRRFWFFTYQGMVPRRQKEIAKVLGEEAADEVLRPDYLVEHLLTGESGDRIVRLIATKVDQFVDQKMGLLKPMSAVLIGEKLTSAKEKIVKRAIASFPQIADELEYYLKSAIGVGELLEVKLTALSARRFEDILRGLFKEDEALLIAYGGVLGAAMGLVQAGMLLL